MVRDRQPALPDGRGAATRSAILERAVDLASVEGLEGLTIGRLAADVIEPAMSSPEGAPRLRAIADAYLAHLDRDAYSGGCFWAATSVEYDDRPGPVRDAVATALDAWLGELERQARIAGADNPRRFAFELFSLVMGANSRYRLSGGDEVFGYAREAIDRLIGELPDG